MVVVGAGVVVVVVAVVVVVIVVVGGGGAAAAFPPVSTLSFHSESFSSDFSFLDVLLMSLIVSAASLLFPANPSFLPEEIKLI